MTLASQKRLLSLTFKPSLYFTQWQSTYVHTVFTVSTGLWANARLILGHRLRRWPSINITLAQCRIFSDTFFVAHFALHLKPLKPSRVYNCVNAVLMILMEKRPEWSFNDSITSMLSCIIVKTLLQQSHSFRGISSTSGYIYNYIVTIITKSSLSVLHIPLGGGGANWLKS